MNTSHEATIRDQFTRQAAGFAAAPELHNEAIHALMIDAAQPRASDRMPDIACGPGSVVVAFAPYVARAVGVDTTPAMPDPGARTAGESGTHQHRLAAR